MSAPVDPQAHDAPLLWLRDRLHAGTTLAERVRKLRWKRRKAKTEATDERAKSDDGGELGAPEPFAPDAANGPEAEAGEEPS